MFEIVQIVAGIALVLNGRSMYWLFVSIVGFAIGIWVSIQFLGDTVGIVNIVIGVVFGLLGMFLARFAQKFAVFIAGFFAGAYVLNTAANIIAPQLSDLAWVMFLIGGLMGALFMVLLFDWALIVVSTLSGATLVVTNVQLVPFYEILIFFGLVIAGVIIQATQKRDEVNL